MKLTIPTNTFRAGVARAADAAKTANALPILGNLKLEARGSSLIITGNNLDQIARTILPCDVLEPGKITLSAVRLSAISKSIGSDSLSLNTDKFEATIIAGNNKYQLPGLDAEEFPADIKPEKEEGAWTLGASAFREALQRVAAFQTDDPTRAELQGVFWHSEGAVVNVVATNGRGLGITSIALGGPKTGVIMPSDFVAQALRATADYPGDITLRSYANCLSLSTDAVVLTTRLIEAVYPAYLNIVPERFTGDALVDRTEFLTELRRVSAVGLNEQRQCTPDLEFTGKELLFRVFNGPLGTAHGSIRVASSGTLKIRMDARYLEAALRNLDCKEVRFEWTGERNPFVIKAADNFTAVIMPMRVLA